MNKGTKTLIFLSIVLILFIGIFVASSRVEKNKTDDNIQQNNNSISLGISDKNIDFVNVKNQSDQYTVKVGRDEGKETYLILNENREVSQSMLEIFMDTLKNMKPLQIVDETSEELSKYGLDNENANIDIVFEDGTNMTLKLGDDAPLSQGAYMLSGKDRKIYLILESDKEIFLNTKEFYLNPKND